MKVSITIQASLLVFNCHLEYSVVYVGTERENVIKMGKRKLNGPAGEESPVKRKKSSQKFLDSYRELWPCLLPSRKGAHFVHCSVCVSDFSCMHAWRNDCKRHVDSKQHKDYEQLKSKQKSIKSFIPQVTIQQQQVTNAELLMSQFICHWN